MSLNDMMPHTFTLWSKGVVDEFSNATFTRTTDHPCRWQDTQAQYRDDKGELVLSRAICYTELQSVKVGDWIVKGTVSGGDPKVVTAAYEVKSVQMSPSIGGDETLVKVMM